MFKKIVNFFKESLEELKKVTWPEKDEAINSAVIVILFVVTFAMLLFLIDLGVQKIVLWLVD